MSKWIVQLDYEFGEFEPNSIYFRRVCSDDMEYGSAYDTKREALEAFCLGQYAINQLRKEKEAEQKKEEEKKVKVDMSEETRKRLEKLAPISLVNIGWEAEAETSPYDGSITSVSFCEVVDGYPTKDEALKALVEKRSGGDGKEDCSDGLKEYAKPDFKVKVKSPTEESLEKIENRLTEIEGVLSSIGSPEYDLRKKVEGLEKGLAQLTDTFYICANNETHNYEDLRKRVEAIETQTGKKNIEEINEGLEMVDKGKADTFYEQVNKTSKNDYKECKANPFRCEKCGLEFKVVSQERALVEHCPSCGDKPKRIED